MKKVMLIMVAVALLAMIMVPQAMAQTRVEGDEIVFEFDANQAVSFQFGRQVKVGYERPSANLQQITMVFSAENNLVASAGFRTKIKNVSRIAKVEVFGHSVVENAIDEKFLSWQKGYELKETEPGSGIWQARVKLPLKYPNGTDLHLNFRINGNIWTPDPELTLDDAWANSILSLPDKI